MWGRAQLLVLLTALSAYGDDVQEESQLSVGRSINVYTRYGYLCLSMKVVSRERDNSTFIFREPTVNIFTDLDRFAVHAAKKKPRRVFEGDFHMEFCDNLKQLVQAYFRSFDLERLDSPWKAFTASWSPETIAKNMGINSSFVLKDNCYVLVRLSRFRSNVTLSSIPNNIRLSEMVEEEIDKIQLGDVSSVLRFIGKYGSHYIDSYVTGNSLYQVFVLKRPLYLSVKERLRSKGISSLDRRELDQYFAPWFAEHMGQIKVASGNKTVEQWVANKLRVHYYIFSYPTLLKVHGNHELLSVLNELLGNEAILEIGLKTLAPAFKDPRKREFFLEVVDNLSKLWEENL